MDNTFWERSWKTISPERISSYAEGFDMSEDEIIAFLKKKNAKTVCDAGCGCGLYSLKLARFGFTVSGFDISENAALLTKNLLSENGYPGADFKRADVLSTGYPAESFDAVVSRDVIDHMPINQAVKAVRELLRIVKPGGRVILTLDETDGEYESEPHVTSADGDYQFTSGKWSGMTFHPYSASDIKKLADGLGYGVLPSEDSGFTAIIGAGYEL